MRAFVGAMFAVVVAQGLLPAGDGIARAAAPEVSASLTGGGREGVVGVMLHGVGHGYVAVTRSDFTLSADGDMFAVQKWSARGSRIRIRPGHSRRIRLTFAVTDAAIEHGALIYRPSGGAVPIVVSLDGPSARRAQQPTINTFVVAGGVGDPWGAAVDSSGKVWFAEPGCDFAPTCGAEAPPGQIVELDPSSGALTLHTLPSIPGNQPIFVAFDGSGELWFTTPNNDMVGEFSPSTGTFVGQWPVTAGSGPWDLTFANGQIWYTEHLASAVGAFDPASHAHQDFQTPSADSNPYGIAASGGRIWFTENNSSVDRVAALDTSRGNAISEYPIVEPLSGTPHLIVVGAGDQPWWTEGWSNTIATLNPADAMPGSCGRPSGTCDGVQRFQLPPSTTCSSEAHTSGIAFDAPANRIWLDDSTTAQVGSFTPSTQTFVMTTLSNCSAHPHDGLTLDSVGNLWFDEEFENAIGELPAAAGATPPATSANTPAPAVGAAPLNTAAPTIRGRPRQGRTLTAQSGAWMNGPTNFRYGWQRCERACASIVSATSASYKLVARDVDAKVRVVVTATNTAGRTQATSRSVGPVAPSAKRVEAALAQLFRVDTITARNGYRASFHPPSSGSLRIAWHARRVLVAAGSRRFSKAHPAQIRIRLTRPGKKLLERASKLTLVVKAVFIPSRARPVTRVRRFSVAP